jgi:hypothetical protein
MSLQMWQPQTNGPSSSGPVDVAPASVPDCTTVSPDSLMAYCQARLDSLDSQMDGIFQQQEKNGTMTKDVNQVASLMNDLPGPTSGSSPTIDASSSASQIDTAYQQAIQDAGGNGTQLGAELQKDQNSFDSAVKSGNGSIPSTTANQLTQNLKNYASDLNSDSEMSMVNLQSLMSQRETAVQLTTNLTQSLSQQTSDITKNVGQ